MNTRMFAIILTAIGTVFLDFCADVCQSPCRAYLLDVSIPEEHSTGLTIFCLNSGIGSAVGYGIAAIKWDIMLWGNILEGQVVVVFAIITIFYLIFVSSSLYSFPEIPMTILKDSEMGKEYQEKRSLGKAQNDTELSVLAKRQTEYSATTENYSTYPQVENSMKVNGGLEVAHINSLQTEVEQSSPAENPLSEEQASLKDYLKSIVFMPKSLRILSLTNLFYGMGIICYSLFFTDFVGECVFNGDPQQPKDSKSYELYEDGVRFACWGMAFSSLFCAFYSGFVEDLAERFGVKIVFIGGALVYAAGMALMAITKNRIAVIVLSATAGVMYTTLSTVPYILVAHYHNSQKFREDGKITHARGIGTDVATVVSAVVLSQFLLSLSMGSVVAAVGSNVVVAYSAVLFSICGAIIATQVMYLDM